MNTLFGSAKVIVCLGAGGVGKTTTAAALGMALADAGENVVVLTIDPAKRLADALGQRGELANEPRQVQPPGRRWQGSLWAAMLDPSATLETIIRSDAPSDEVADRVLTNPLLGRLTQSLSGTNEYMAVERLYQLLNDDRFDRIVIDTPPSHHVFDFLDSPGRLMRFVDHRLYRSVFAAKPGLFGTVRAGGQLILRLLGGLVGSHLVEEVMTFFSDFEGFDQGFRNRASAIDKLLGGQDTAYVLVTVPRTAPVTVGQWMLDGLEERQRRVCAVVVNRVLPIDQSVKVGNVGNDDPLRQNYRQLLTLADREAALVSQLGQPRVDETSTDSPALLVLHEQQHPVATTAQLRELGAALTEAAKR